jgi:RNA polymerase sigma factor (sigma-70 family)
MNGSGALTSCKGPEVSRSVPIFIYDDLSFDSFYVAEPDSNRPAHFVRLLRLLRRKGRSQEDAEDLIQEAMLRLHLYAKSDVVVHEEAFLRHAVRNLAIDHYRRDRSRAGREVQIDDVDRQHPLIAPSATPDQIFDYQQRLDQLTALLDSVSRRTREVYFAHQSGYTYAEIANNMGIAQMTVKRHIARAHLLILNHIDK